MAREISITFALNAALKGGFTAAFQSAAASARGVASAVREMERSPTGRLGASIASQREKIKGLSGSLKDARATLVALQNQAQATGGGTRMLARQIAQAESRVNNLSSSLNRQLGTWRETTAEAATVGGSVRRLADEYANLQAKMERAKKISSSLHANQAQADNLRSQRADLQGRLLSTAATTASVALPVKLAISAEDTFADLRKVMDAPEEVMQQVFADAQAMSSRTGKSFEDVVAIMTAAAQAGLGKTREELLGVADQAVKMSIAWGVSAERAGKSLATWQASMGLTAEQARHTGDVINALSNEMNAEAGDIDAIFTRLGPMMKESGMATQDIAALATAFKAAGAEVEVSGTAMKNFVKAMAAGSAGLTDEKAGIYKYLQIDPNQLQKQLYTDSKGAILRVLKALKKVNPEELNSISSKLFGEESIAAISPLMGQIDQLEKAYKIANGKVDGSVDAEYTNRMKTTATSISQMNQSLRNLGITAGKTLLPAVGAVARGITTVVGHISSLVERFPGLSSAVMVTGAAIAAFAVGSLALGLVMNTVRTSVNSVRGVMLRLASSQMAATTSTGVLSGASGIFSGIATMAGKAARSFAGGARSIASSSTLAAVKTGIMSVATGAFAAASKIAGAGARFFAGGLRSIFVATGVGALLVGLGFAINLLIDNWDSVVDAMSGAWTWVTDTWGRLGVFFTELGKNLSPIFSEIWNDVCGLAASAKDAVVGVWNGIAGFFGGLWSGVTSAAATAWQGLAGLASTSVAGVIAVWNGIVSIFSGIGRKIAGVFSGAWNGITSIWNNAASFFSGAGNGITAAFAQAKNGLVAVWSGVTVFFAGLWNRVIAGVSFIGQAFRTVFSSACDAVAGVCKNTAAFFSGLWSGIVSIASGASQAITSFFTSAYDSVLAVWNGANAFFSSVGAGIIGVFIWLGDSIVTVWSGVSSFFAGIWNGLAAGASWLSQTVISFFAGAYNGIAAIWNGAIAIFSAIGQSIVGVFSWASDSVVGAWLGMSDFFAGVGAFISQTFSGCWEFVIGIATWAYDGIASIWNGAVEFFSGIVSGISGVFTGLFDWLREKFAWVFSTINAVSGFVGKITGAVTNAWNKAFGDKEAEKGAGKNPATSTAAATPGEKPLAPNAKAALEKPSAAKNAIEKPAAPIANQPIKLHGQNTGAQPAVSAAQSAAENPAAKVARPVPPRREQSYAKFKEQEEAAKKQGKKSSGGGSSRSGSGRATGGSSATTPGASAVSGATQKSGPITVVTLAGDNNAPQTVFIPAQTRQERPVMTTATGQASPSPKQPPVFSAPLKMPAVQAARSAAEVPRALPQTPALISGKTGRPPNGGQPASIQIELSQQFDLIAQDAAVVRKVMESLKPDFEALVRRSLEKLQSDRRRTAYAQ